MLVFIDESGDSGFRIAEGATPIFVAAMVVFRSGEDAAETQQAIEAGEARRLHKPAEFKFSKCGDHIRDAFFQDVRDCPFQVRTIVVRKEMIHSSRLRADKDSFYEYFVKQMIIHDDGLLRDAEIIIDGSRDREFGKKLHAALRRRKADGTIKNVRFKDSRRDVLVQLADMCVGAIARSCRTDRRNADRWRKMLAQRIDDVWDFP